MNAVNRCFCRERTPWRSETHRRTSNCAAPRNATECVPYRIGLALALGAWLIAPRDAPAQVIARCPRSSVSLLTDAIFYDAAVLLNAQGNFLVSAAVARNLNAEAASKEMDNSVKWVSTYFERRRLNREARAAENPGYLDRQEKQQETYRRRIDKNLASGTDLSDELNFMLRGLLANASPSIFMSDQAGSLISSEDNVPLSADDRHQVRVTEGKLAGGKALVFRVDTAEILETRWPPVLREERFDAARTAFENARDWAIDDLKTEKEVRLTNEKRLKAAVDRLSSELIAAYPRERCKTFSPQEGLAFIDAQRFLRSLAMSTFRLIETNSSLAFDRTFRFQGKSVGELLQHMVGKGLEFAPPEPGGEPTYRTLYYSVRAFYERLVPEPEKK